MLVPVGRVGYVGQQGSLPWFANSKYAAQATDGTTVYPAWIMEADNQRYASGSVSGSVQQVSQSDLLSGFTRSSKGWARNASGQWIEYQANQPRFHFIKGRTRQCILFEPAATNRLLNSRSPATQTTASLSTGTYVLWVEGSGTATSSAGTATGTGFGAATENSPNTFTLTGAGTVTVTVTGSLTLFQLESGRQTSFIETAGTVVTRAADRFTQSLGSYFNSSEYSVVIEYEFEAIDTSSINRIMQFYTNSSNRVNLGVRASSSELVCGMLTSGVNVASGSLDLNPLIATTGEVYKTAYAVKTNNTACSTNGTYPNSATSITIPSVTNFSLGDDGYSAANPMYGGIYSMTIYPKALSQDAVQQQSNPLPAPSIPVDMFIIAGQSNADGRGLDSELSAILQTFYGTSQPNLKIWSKPVTRTGTTATTGSFAYDGAWWELNPDYDAVGRTTDQVVGNAGSTVAVQSETLHGVELKLAYNYAQAFPTQELRIVKTAIGGSTIEGEWGVSDADRTKLYALFRNIMWYQALYEMRREGKYPRNIWIYWQQGETDATNGMSQVDYEGYLQTLVNRFNSELGYSVAKIVVGGLNASHMDAYDEVIKAAQAAVVAANTNTAYLITDGTGSAPAFDIGADGIHFSAEGYEQIADGIAEILGWTE